MNETRYGKTVTDRDGVRWVQVFEYEDGECVDRYISKMGTQI